jgi:hypothetical protein
MSYAKDRMLTHKYTCIGHQKMLNGSSLLEIVERTKFQASWTQINPLTDFGVYK